MRQRYETEEDLKKEADLKLVIESFTNSKLEKLPMKYFADFLAFRKDEPVALIEVKIREKLRFGDRPEYMISLNKILGALMTSEALRVPFLLFVKFLDEIGYAVIMRSDIKNIHMSTNYRGDPDDVEPCVFLPMSVFKTMNHE